MSGSSVGSTIAVVVVVVDAGATVEAPKAVVLVVVDAGATVVDVDV
ncbi:hypothetical protein HQ535_02135, partial [bacterium]|nr:hypothetical protein [bacterium]